MQPQLGVETGLVALDGDMQMFAGASPEATTPRPSGPACPTSRSAARFGDEAVDRGTPVGRQRMELKARTHLAASAAVTERAAQSTLESAPAEPDGSSAAGRTLIERACAQLREDILAGVVVPGERLRVEHPRSHDGVGAGTLRGAISRRVSDAPVEADGRRGFRIVPATRADLDGLARLRLEIEALHRPRREALNVRFHEARLAGQAPRRTLRVLRLADPHDQRCRRDATDLAGSRRDVRDEHDAHRQIVEHAVAGRDARAARAPEAHDRGTPDLLQVAWPAPGTRRQGLKV